VAEKEPISRPAAHYVEETRFGFWFLQSRVWQQHVLRVAIEDLRNLISGPRPSQAVLLDAGCGQGKAFSLLQQAFAPAQLIGLDADPYSLHCAQSEADHQNVAVQLLASDCAAIQLPDASIDIVFCHQTFHHLVAQEQALAEFWRILKPGGLLLFAESTKYYIDTWVIRWLFRHPMQVQKSAKQYLGMLSAQGFQFADHNVSYPYLWWSRARDFGLLERFGICRAKAFGQRRETLVNAAVRKSHEPGAV
jgi:ubiquinone/menaquinone biosynthesis C-methylase UbiE